MNKDYNKREQILFGEDYNSNKYLGGIRHFNCSRDIIQTLLDEDFIDPNGNQNESPTTEEFLEITKNLKHVEFCGYTVCPERSDYRTTIEEVNIIVPDEEYDTLTNCIESLRYADEFSIEHININYYIHAWWD